MTTRVYKFGIRKHAAVPDEVLQQIRIAHRMKNSLVELELRHEQALKNLWSSYPEIATIEKQLADAETEVEKLVKRARSERSSDRKSVTRSNTAAELTQARKRVRELRAQRRTEISIVYASLKPRIEALRAERKAAIKACRQQYASEGLYWATYNHVIAKHQTAVKIINRRRNAGQPAALRFRRFRGTGAISVQLQCAASDPVRSPQLLGSGKGKWRNVLQLTPWMPPEKFDALPRCERRRIGRTGEVVMQIGGGHTVTLPVTVHRMIPADADICEAQLVVSRIGPHKKIDLCVTVKLPNPEPVQDRPMVALHGGWRKRHDGSVRVGTWASTQPLTAPSHLADVVVSHDGGRWGEIILPESWLNVAARPPAVRSRRDTGLEAVKKKLADWLDAHPQPETDDTPPPTGEDVRRWRSADRFDALAIRWRDQPPIGDGADKIVRILESWRVQDRHLWSWEAHERHQITGRRDDAWRRVGAWLASNAGTILVDDTDLKSVRQTPDVADNNQALPEIAARKARARAALAAPGRLRQYVVNAAATRAVAIQEVDASYVTRTHRTCGHVDEAHPRYAASSTVVCTGCGAAYDQDHNAVGIMLDRARSC